MSLSHETMMELMAYADDELAADDRARVERLIACDPDAARVIASLVGVGEWTRAADEARSLNGADAIADRVMAQIEGKGGVSDLVEARAKRAARLRRGAAFAFAAVAMAAGIFLFVHGGDVAPTVARVAPTESVPPRDAPSARPVLPLPEMAAAVQSSQPLGVEVGKIDSQSKDVSVFYLPAGSGENGNAPSVVIWLDDDTAGAKK